MKLLTTAEAAKLLKVSRVRVRQLYYAGRLPGHLYGGRVLLFGQREVERFKRIPRPVGRPKAVLENSC